MATLVKSHGESTPMCGQTLVNNSLGFPWICPLKLHQLPHLGCWRLVFSGHTQRKMYE